MKRKKPKLKLCCQVNPATGEEIAFGITLSNPEEEDTKCFCVYCRQDICATCINLYIVDDFYHHEECKELCPHIEQSHDEAI